MRELICLLAVLATVVSAKAGATDWQEIAPGTELRLISADIRDPDGTTLVGLQVHLAPQTKTYWRVPGETGIPLTLDFSGSTGIAGHEILWPMPSREIAGGFVDHVYYGEVTFPIRLRLDEETTHVAFSLVMGVCSDICVPVEAGLAYRPDFSQNDVASRLRLEQALADVPVPWNGPDDTIGPVHADPDTGGLTVGISEDLIDTGSIIASTYNPGLVFGPPQKSPTINRLTFQQLGWGEPADVVGQDVMLIFQAPGGPYEATRTAVGVE